jgi:Flp pilus assembly secretin CpaC
MRILHLTTAALMAAFIIGCSKSPSQPTSGLPAGTKDLGVIEFTEGTPQQFSLGGGKSCTATAKQIDGGKDIEVDLAIQATNADGTVMDLGRPRISTLPGRQCAISTGEVSIELTPKWKTP